MLRILQNNLTLAQDKIFYNDEPFTGLSYEFNDDGVLHQLSIIEDGIKTGVSNDIINPDSTVPRVHFDALVDIEDAEFYDKNKAKKHDSDNEEEIYTFQEKIFNGYAFQFNPEGILIDESYFHYGCIDTPCRKWYDSGIMMESDLNEETLEWHPNGQLKNRKIFVSDKGTLFRINFDQTGKLRFLKLTDFYEFDVHELDSFVFNKELRLSGNAMNDQVLNIICSNSSLSNVSFLGISRSDISGSKIVSIINDNIAVLELTANKRMESSIVDQITEKFPNCKVHYDDEKYLNL